MGDIIFYGWSKQACVYVRRHDFDVTRLLLRDRSTESSARIGLFSPPFSAHFTVAVLIEGEKATMIVA